MTRLERIRTAAAVPAGFRGPGRVSRALELLEGRMNGTLAFKSTVWKAAKPQLKIESGGKCAYCESPTDTVAHGDVEHFRPKSVYWWLAYCYENYVYACQICNQVYKSDEFPIDSSLGRWTGPVIPAGATAAVLDSLAQTMTPDPIDIGVALTLADFRSVGRRELPGLVDPYDETVDPDTLFKWVADDTLKEVELKAASTSAASKRAFKAVTTYYGLNREELRRWRWKTYHELETLGKALVAFEASNSEPALRAQIKADIRAMSGADAPYAGMVRYFVKKMQLPV